MSKFYVINPERHVGKSWRWLGNYTYASKEAVAPIVGGELAKAALAMPIAFIEQSAGRYSLVAVTSLIPDANMFVGPQGQWLGTYIPAIYRSYPFRLIQPESSGQAALCIDEESGALADADQKAHQFFGMDGKPSPELQAVMDFLSGLERTRLSTDLAVAALAEAGVIRPWTIKVRTGERQERPVAGLHRIDEAALNDLDDVSFLRLRKASALLIAYAQLFSSNQLGVFERLLETQDRLRKAEKASYRLPPELDLDNKSSELVFDAATLARLKE